jgi:hypothetical protein
VLSRLRPCIVSIETLLCVSLFLSFSLRSAERKEGENFRVRGRVRCVSYSSFFFYKTTSSTNIQKLKLLTPFMRAKNQRRISYLRRISLNFS